MTEYSYVNKYIYIYICILGLYLSPCVLLASMRCIHVVVLIQTQLVRNPDLLHQRDQIDNLPIAYYTFARHMLTSLSVDEILLPKYVNLSTNF